MRSAGTSRCEPGLGAAPGDSRPPREARTAEGAPRGDDPRPARESSPTHGGRPAGGDPRAHGGAPPEREPQAHGARPAGAEPQAHGETPSEREPQAHGAQPASGEPLEHGEPPSEREPQAHGAQPARGAAARPGSGRVAVERIGGRSVVCRAYATSPLRLLTPKNHGHAAWVYTSSHGGGLVDGDDVAVRASVGAGAAAFLSTQSATKVYRSPRGTRTALDAEVGEDALLVAAPDAVVCFAGSRYRQTQRIALDAGARLVLVDRVTSGRRESGERWRFDEYFSRTVVHLGGRLVVHDATALRASDGPLADRFGRYDVLAVAMVIGRGLEDEATRIDARVRGEPVGRRADRLLAAAPVGDAGCILRLAGRTVEDVDAVLEELLGFVPGLLGDNPWARKW